MLSSMHAVQLGKVSSGNSLDMTDHDKSIMDEHEANVKDMEVIWLAVLKPFLSN